MCGRFTLAAPPEIVAEFFGLDEVPALTPRYNFAPTQEIPCVIAPQSRRRELRAIRWGLVPAGAKDVKVGNSMINARAETVATKAAFRDAFRRRRCLVVADGFYEWKKLSWGKQPYYIRMKEDAPLAFVGLWERAEIAPGQPLDTCTIITGEPNDLVRELHDRMPVILDRGAFAEWLDVRNQDTAALQRLLQPFPAERMRAYPVSPRVNKPEQDDAACITPVKEQETFDLWKDLQGPGL